MIYKDGIFKCQLKKYKNRFEYLHFVINFKYHHKYYIYDCTVIESIKSCNNKNIFLDMYSIILEVLYQDGTIFW